MTKPKRTTTKPDYAARKAQDRKRKKAMGLVQKEVWIHPTHSDALRDFLASLPEVSPGPLPGQQALPGFD